MILSVAYHCWEKATALMTAGLQHITEQWKLSKCIAGYKLNAHSACKHILKQTSLILIVILKWYVLWHLSKLKYLYNLLQRHYLFHINWSTWNSCNLSSFTCNATYFLAFLIFEICMPICYLLSVYSTHLLVVWVVLKPKLKMWEPRQWSMHPCSVVLFISCVVIILTLLSVSI